MATIGYVSSLDPNSPDTGWRAIERRHRPFEYQYRANRTNVPDPQQCRDEVPLQDLDRCHKLLNPEALCKEKPGFVTATLKKDI